MKAILLTVCGAFALLGTGFVIGSAPAGAQSNLLFGSLAGCVLGGLITGAPRAWRWWKSHRYDAELRTLHTWLAVFPHRCPICSFHRHAYENGCDLGRPLPHRCPDTNPSVAEVMAQGVRDMQVDDALSALHDLGRKP
jgi:hypothetical protein